MTDHVAKVTKCPIFAGKWRIVLDDSVAMARGGRRYVVTNDKMYVQDTLYERSESDPRLWNSPGLDGDGLVVELFSGLCRNGRK